MPRNDQVTRQWHLLRKLKGSRGATLQELTESLPDDIPANFRAIRRGLIQHFENALMNPFTLKRPVGPPEEARCCRAVSKDRRADGIRVFRRMRSAIPIRTYSRS